MTARILIVCTANICRSPLVERLLQAYLDRYAPDATVEVSSAGTNARPGHAAAEGMRTVASTWGLDLEGHVSRRVDAELAQASDLIITMEDRHRSVVSRLTAGLGQRTFTVTELAALVRAVGAEDDASPGAPGGSAVLAEHVRRWHAIRARISIDAPDVADPYGGPQDGYRETAWQLADLVEQLGPAITAAVTD